MFLNFSERDDVRLYTFGGYHLFPYDPLDEGTHSLWLV